MLQKVQSLIPTINSMYFYGPNVTVLGEGGLQAAHVVGGRKGIHQEQEQQEHAMHRNPQARRNKLFVCVNQTLPTIQSNSSVLM